MQSEDWILSVFFGALALATALSLFLWFVKGARSGALVGLPMESEPLEGSLLLPPLFTRLTCYRAVLVFGP